jgi:hypothetical protein
MLGPPADPGAYIAVDRLLFVINQAGGDPDVTVRRLLTDINTLEIISNTPGSVANSTPVSIDIPAGSPLIAELVDLAGEGDGKTAGELSGGDYRPLPGSPRSPADAPAMPSPSKASLPAVRRRPSA